MPAILTHDFFGQDAFGAALSVASLFTPDERDAFLLGNQGPDPLFYLMLMPPLKEFERLGSNMHHDAPSELFCALAGAIDELDARDRSVARAYLAGFTCHYLLDRAMHPLVFYWERGICNAEVPGLNASDHSIVHAEIEKDLDEMVLFTKRNQTVGTYKPFEEVLQCRDDVLQAIGRLYAATRVGPLANDESTKRVFPLAVACFRFAQRLFYSPNGTQIHLLATLEKPLLHNRYSLLEAMAHRVRAELTSDFDNRRHLPWHDPFTGALRHESFWDIYDATLLEVEDALRLVLSDDFDLVAARTFTQGVNFNGEVVQ